MELAAKITTDVDGMYGIGVRGSRSWATIHPGFLSGYANFGETDFTMENDKLMAAMATPGSKAFHADWVKMIQDSGPRDWATYTWYQVGTDLGAGASAMIYDADILGYFMNGGDNAEAGNLAYARLRANPDAAAPTPNVWIWSLGHERVLEPEGGGLATSCSGHRARSTRSSAPARWTSSTRSASRSGRMRPSRTGSPRAIRAISSSSRTFGAGREDLLHAAAAVLRPDDRVGVDAAEDGRQRGAGRRRASTSWPRASTGS